MTILDELRNLSAAEEFFTMLGVDFDPAVVRVSRLHILRRMGQYLAGATLDGLPDAEARAACRAHLEKAYQLFVESTPIEQRLFKVHKDAVKPAEAPKKTFVQLAPLAVTES